jgi:hypothetical protein
MKKGIESPLSLYKCYFAGQCCFACLHNLKINYFVVSLGHTNTITIIYLCFPDFLFCEKMNLNFKFWWLQSGQSNSCSKFGDYKSGFCHSIYHYITATKCNQTNPIMGKKDITTVMRKKAITKCNQTNPIMAYSICHCIVFWLPLYYRYQCSTKHYPCVYFGGSCVLNYLEPTHVGCPSHGI